MTTTRSKPATWQIGFTLVELMITLAIAGILLLVAVPSFSQFINNQGIKAATQSLQASLSLARVEAVKRRGSVYMVANGQWQQGWALTTSSTLSYNDCLSANSACLFVGDAFPQVNIQQGDNLQSLEFARNGRPLLMGNNFNFTVCDKNVSPDFKRSIVQVGVSGVVTSRRAEAC